MLLLAVDYLLFIVRNVNVNPNPDEVADIRYVNQEQLKELVRKADAGEDGLKLSPWFKLVVNNFLFKWWDHLEKGSISEIVDMKTIHKLTWNQDKEPLQFVNRILLFCWTFCVIDYYLEIEMSVIIRASTHVIKFFLPKMFEILKHRLIKHLPVKMRWHKICLY